MATNNSQHRCVFVGNIPYDASEEQLIQICEEVGPVVSFRLVIDRETGKPKGYGFCEYKDEETALSARRNLQGYEINGRQLRVDFAENDKGADKSREQPQGRGGPGLTSNADVQRSSGGPAILGDSALYQPIGLPSASTAASVMAGALGGVQIDSMSKQSGMPSQSGFASDPLTLHLSNMTKKQLYDIMAEMKVMGTQNKDLARQLLSLCPVLLKALFQAQIMLGMVPPQEMQMLNIRQKSPSLLPQATVLDGMQDPKLAMRPPYPGQPPFTHNKTPLGIIPRLQDTQGPAIPQNTSVNNQLPNVPFQQVSVQPRYQPQQAQSQPMLPATGPVQPGVLTVPSLRPLSGLSLRPLPPALESSSSLQQQVQQTPLLPGGSAHSSQLGFQNSTHQSVLPRPLSSQPNFQPGSSNAIMGSGLIDGINKHGVAQVTNEIRFPGSNSNLITGTQEQTSTAGKSFDSMHHPSKLARLEDGRSAIHNIVGQNTTTTIGSGTTSVFLPRNQVPRTDMIQNSEKQVLQLAPDVQSALLEQVKSLTPEQLSSLPPEQRQQVIDLQKMLQ